MTDDARTNTHLTQRTKREMRVSRTSAAGPHRRFLFADCAVPSALRRGTGAMGTVVREHAHHAHTRSLRVLSPLSFPFLCPRSLYCVVLCPVPSRPVLSAAGRWAQVRQQRTEEQRAGERRGEEHRRQTDRKGRGGGPLHPAVTRLRLPRFPPAPCVAAPSQSRRAPSEQRPGLRAPLTPVRLPVSLRSPLRRASTMAAPKPTDSGSPPSPDSPQPESRPPRIRAVPAEEARFLWTFFRHKPLPKVRGEGGSTGE
jgi:hypothetical protein